ncbi:HMG (high mobility group) box [Geosmithia morbida]|uniref:HMG (High mobility group) box n=1 Tax=Geosmithia morbida TaxID=1094350 RepID=A0A9P5D6B9_9HYPO|nr:HMG (high mobility group) box [Geosmithia morbida]KAF4123349.1 HMG (high mobility group) box [Geosmithia morbida]
MGRIAMPSPTPSAHEALFFTDGRDSLPHLTTTHPLDGLHRGRRAYDTPPLDETGAYDDDVEPPVKQQQNNSLAPQDDQKKPSKKAIRRERRKRLQYPDLVEPLSQWGRKHGIEPKDVHSFATRDIQKRISQAMKSGYVKRNLNVFFLYKRAYSDVAQAWMEIHHPDRSKTQPPIVSLVGESWSKESAEFKESYTVYSDLEKKGLRNAFPDYKYKPGAKKVSTPGRSVSSAVPTPPPGDGSSARPSSRYHTPALDEGRYSRYQTPTPQPHYGTPHHDDEGIRGLQVYYDTAHYAVSTVAPSSTYGTSPMPTTYDGGSLLVPTVEGGSLFVLGSAGSSSFAETMPRSVSPYYHDTLTSLPVDPILTSHGGEYIPSPSRSVEPPGGYVVSWQDVQPSSQELYESEISLACPKVEPSIAFPAMTDSMLTSVPTGDEKFAPHHGLSTDEHSWRLDVPPQEDPLHQFTWAMEDWSHEFSA